MSKYRKNTPNPRQVVARYGSPFDPQDLQFAQCEVYKNCGFRIEGVDYINTKLMMGQHLQEAHDIPVKE